MDCDIGSYTVVFFNPIRRSDRFVPSDEIEDVGLILPRSWRDNQLRHLPGFLNGCICACSQFRKNFFTIDAQP